jgi:hypothetical protein
MPAGVSAITPLANLTLGSAQATITFSSISQTYRDLILVIMPVATTTGNAGRMRFNSDTGSNYSWVQLYGDGSTAASSANGSTTEMIGIQSETARTNSVLQIMDYSATNKHKSVLARSNNAAVITTLVNQRWANTAAITSIEVFMTGGTTYAAGSTFALYGVSA